MEQTFGTKLRVLRRQADITQRKLAELVGVDFSYISKLENNRLPPAAAETIIKICEALNIAPNELLATTGKIPPNVQQSVGTSPAAIQFLSNAHDMELSEEEWEQLTQQLEQLRNSS